MTAIIVTGLVLGVIVALAGVVVPLARDGRTPDGAEHHGADAEYATDLHNLGGPVHADPLTAETPAVYTSRHHEDTVEIVVGEYRPVYSKAFASVMGHEYAGRAAVR